MKLFIILGITLIFSSLSAQPPTNWQFDAGYSGGIIVHPGFSLGVYKPVKARLKTTKNERVVQKYTILGGRAGVYYHKNYQTGIMLEVLLARKRINDKGRSFAISLGAGLNHTQISNTYVVDDGGSVDHKASVGLTYFMLHPAVEWGWRFKKPLGPLTGWYLRPSIQWQFPYFQGTNQYLLLGVGFQINSWK